MRTKSLIPGFKNMQKIRFILIANSGESIGMGMTISQVFTQFRTTAARVIVTEALEKLAKSKTENSNVMGICYTLPHSEFANSNGFSQIQVDLE